MKTSPRRLRELINADDLLVLPGAFDAISARLVQQCGFDAIYFSGGLSASTFLALPDFGTRTLTEAAAQVAGAAAATSIPILADGEAGFGTVLSVQRMVREMERAGAGGIHLEDQAGARRCGHFAGKELVTLDEHVGRIRAAVAARNDPDFVIVARTDAIAVAGFDEAVARSRAYVAAGADVVFVEAPETPEQLRALPQLFSVPVLLNVVEGGKTPFLSVAEVASLGYAAAIYPCTAFFASLFAMRAVLAEFRQTGTSKASWNAMASFEQWQELVGVPDAIVALDSFGVALPSVQH